MPVLTALAVMAGSTTSSQAGAKPKLVPTTKLNQPTIECYGASPASIDLNVCAGASGAPAGFSVQWMTKAEYDALGGWPLSSEVVEGSSFCKASFSGVPGNSTYNLGPNACAIVQIGDNLFDDVGASSPCAGQPLVCGVVYVFRVFAHNVPNTSLNKSDFSGNQYCATSPCDPPCEGCGCTLTQGFWKTHGPVGCVTGNNVDTWPVTSMILGTVNYTDIELCSILNTPAGGNGLLTLAHQLIAAKLNIANGADGSALGTAIADADALIDGLVIPPVGIDSLATSVTSILTTTLDDFNKGVTGPGHCL
jgi:hypothetical protein